MGYLFHGIWPKLANSVIYQIRILIVPFERCLSKLSENHKIVEIGSTELIQVMVTKRVPEPLITQGTVGTCT